MSGTTAHERILAAAGDFVRTGRHDELAGFDTAPFAVYVTDPEGVITYFNHACVGFAGRTPKVGQDRWCVTWKLYTLEGAALPHAECPMAVAITEQRDIRGATAIAQRPDGVRVEFMPFPTPIMADDGRLLGAVNVLVDTSPARSAQALRAQARKYRRLALSVDPDTAERLEGFGQDLDDEADRASVTPPSVY